MKLFLAAEKSFVYYRKIFQPRRIPTCRKISENESRIYRFGVKIDLFGFFPACGAPKRAQNQEKKLVPQNIFLLEKKFSFAPHTHMPKFQPEWPQNLISTPSSEMLVSVLLPYKGNKFLIKKSKTFRSGSLKKRLLLLPSELSK